MRLHVKIIMVFCSLVQWMQCGNQFTQGSVLVAYSQQCPQSLVRAPFKQYLRSSNAVTTPVTRALEIMHAARQQQENCPTKITKEDCPTKTPSPSKPQKDVDSDIDSNGCTDSQPSSPEQDALNLTTTRSFNHFPEYHRGIPPSGSTNSLGEEWYIVGGSPLLKPYKIGFALHPTKPLVEHDTTPPTPKRTRYARQLVDARKPHNTTPPTPKK